MASKIKVKVIVTLDNEVENSSEGELNFDGDMRGPDLAEAIIHVVSQVTSDVVKESIR